MEAIEIIKEFPCNFLGVLSLVDRSTSPLNFGVPFVPLLKMQFPTYPADQLPVHLQNIPATKPGS
jgi:orotate phosphoribosyltransferase